MEENKRYALGGWFALAERIFREASPEKSPASSPLHTCFDGVMEGDGRVIERLERKTEKRLSRYRSDGARAARKRRLGEAWAAAAAAPEPSAFDFAAGFHRARASFFGDGIEGEEPESLSSIFGRMFARHCHVYRNARGTDSLFYREVKSAMRFPAETLPRLEADSIKRLKRMGGGAETAFLKRMDRLWLAALAAGEAPEDVPEYSADFLSGYYAEQGVIFRKRTAVPEPRESRCTGAASLREAV